MGAKSALFMQEQQPTAARLRAYQQFVECRIVPDLRRLRRQQDCLRQQIKDYQLLLREIDTVSQVAESDHLRVDLGDNVLATATIDERERIAVDVGTGIFVDFSMLEALRFCHEKIYHLTKQLQRAQDQTLDAQTHLDLMLSTFEALRQTLVTHEGA